MGNNGNCDVCTGNIRNQMDMRRQKAGMYERYAQRPMMSRTQAECDTCGNTRMNNNCDTCGNTRAGNDCDDCKRTRDELRGMALAMGYVPWQNFECTYEPAQGLRAGTIFPELDKPFYGKRGMR